MKNRMDGFFKVLFYGAIWGILEATLGYLLHFMPGFIAGSVMFPLVLFLLYRAYQSLGSKRAILYVAFVAMAIKSTNLMLPYLTPAKTINPIVAMFFEASLVFLVVPMLDNQSIQKNVSAIIIASFAWRLCYVSYQGINYLVSGYLSSYLESLSKAIEFIGFYGFIGIVISLLILFVSNRLVVNDKWKNIRVSPLITLELVMVAILLTMSL